MLDTRPLLIKTDFPSLQRSDLEVLQVNLGYRCNLSCNHCHVNAGPLRTEQMERDTVELVLQVLEARRIPRLDLTGGAPELNPNFRYLIERAYALNIEIIDRSNLAILLEPDQEDLAHFLAKHRVRVVASLPCFAEENVSEQRGKGTFQSSIKALQKLNSLGYGVDPELSLSLVYNPNGAFLPPPQKQLESEYRQRLHQDFGVSFNQLLTFSNMPIGRFGSRLLSKGQYEQYMALLKSNYSESTCADVMCRSMNSVDWQGILYDCDFNQMLKLPLKTAPSLIASDRFHRHLEDLLYEDFFDNPITLGDHCYSCTAGQGSSCNGALG